MNQAEQDKIRIMIVNDKSELRNITRDYLRKDGYGNLILSENGKSAFKKAMEDKPHLIIADQDIPEMSGLELLKSIRMHNQLADTPFILLSPDVSQKLVARAAEFGVSAYIVKPFSHQTLMDKVNSLLNRLLNPTKLELDLNSAEKLVEDGNLDEALEQYLGLIQETETTMASVHYKVGNIHEKLEEPDLAETSYQQAIGMSENYVNAYDALGSLSITREQHEEALDYFQKSTEISPLNAERQFKLGESLLALGHNEDAEQAFKSALKIDPTQTHLFNRLGITLRRQGKLKESEEYFLRAVESAADDENLLFNLSRVQFARGRDEQALVHLKKALEINPDFTEAHELLTKQEQEKPA